MLAIREFAEIDQLSADNFEAFVGEVFSKQGFEMTPTELNRNGHGDGGIDFVGRRSDRLYAFEVKQRTAGTKVGVAELRQLHGGADVLKINRKILVTNRHFTGEAERDAFSLGIALVNRDELKSLFETKGTLIGGRVHLRDYQKAVLEDLLAKFRQGHSRLLVEMATGLGKTVTAAALVRELWKGEDRLTRVLVVAHRVDLLWQLHRAFRSVLGIVDIEHRAAFAGIRTAELVRPDGREETLSITFASFDTLHNLLQCESSTDAVRTAFDVVIVDEAHHALADTFREVLDRFAPRVLAGFTATPERLDKREVVEFFGGDDAHVGRYDLAWGIRKRKLAAPHYQVFLPELVGLDHDRIHQAETTIALEYVNSFIAQHASDDYAIAHLQGMAATQGERKIVVFCRDIEHVMRVAKMLPLHEARTLHSDLLEATRRQHFEEFRESPTVKYLIVRDILNEGIDIPEVNTIAFLRPTDSRVIWTQQLGRGLRLHGGKKFVDVLDFVCNVERIVAVRELARSVGSDLSASGSASGSVQKAAGEAEEDASFQVTGANPAAVDLLRFLDEGRSPKVKQEAELIDAGQRIVEELPGEFSAGDVLNELLKGRIGLLQLATFFGTLETYLARCRVSPERIEAAMFREILSRVLDYEDSSKGIAPSDAYYEQVNSLAELSVDGGDLRLMSEATLQKVAVQVRGAV